MFFTQITAKSKPSAPMNQKQLCQPARWAIHPRIGAKIISAKYCDELKIAAERPRSLAGNHEATMRPFPGKIGAWAKPEKSRRMKIAANAAPARYPAKPVSRAQSEHVTMPSPYTVFAPKRSSKAPDGNCPRT